MFRKELILGAVVILAFWACNVQAEQILMWEQVNEDGFGDVHNIGTWPCAVFGDYVYVGTESYWETEGGKSHSTGGQLWRVSEDTDWEQVNEDGFGNVNNSMIWPGTVFGTYLYVGAENNFETDEGGGIWRSQTGDPGSWEQVVTNGFGDATNGWVEPWVVFDGYLYAGTSKVRITEGGCEVWRSPDGTTWEQVNTDGFGDANNSEEPIYMSVFGNYLYIGTYNASTGGEIWRTKGLGGPPFTDWEQVNESGFGDVNNTEIWRGTVFGTYLYVGVANEATGGQIWRSPDGTTWQQVNTNGFGDPNNSVCFPWAAFNNYLYAGTVNEQGGGEVWRSSDGNTWIQVNADGFGDANNIGTVPLVVLGDYLYVGTQNLVTGGEVWETKGARVDVYVWSQYWEDGNYQLGLEADAVPGDVESITISGPSYLDTATVLHHPGDDPNRLYDDGQHYDGDANDGYWEVMLNIDATPTVGETITFDINFTDSSTEIKQATINGVFSETATLVSPPDGATVDTLTPTFEWINLSIPVDWYSVQIDDMNHSRVYDCDLPDGTTSHTIPGGYLSWETSYYWLVSAEDANGEALTMPDIFTTISAPPQ